MKTDANHTDRVSSKPTNTAIFANTQTAIKPDDNGPKRELPALAKRVLIVGLDGATFDILTPLIQAGRMPNLERLIKTGTSGVLESTKPPITPAAWTTFMTGKGPGRHGIIDFEKYDVTTNKLSFNSTFEIREKTIWEILSEKGFRVGSINVPMTYPPRKVNGFMISGFETPSIDTDFTYPRHLKDEILRIWPDYNYQTDWKRKTFGGDKLFQRNLRYIEKSFTQGYELAAHCGRHYGWDVMMVLFKLVDNLQHKAWKYLDSHTSSINQTRSEMSARCFTSLDNTIGNLEEFAKNNDSLLIIMSDHGHGSLDGKAQPNLLLKQWGYLKIKSSVKQAGIRTQRIIDRLRGKTTKRFDANLGIEHDLDLDWSQTRACVMHAGMYGFLYISLKGRQPQGIVKPEEYEAVREDLRKRFLAVKCHNRNGRTIQVFPEVHRTEELYNCRREDHPWLPDLLLIPQPGLSVVRKIRGTQPVRWLSRYRMEGTHRVEGILVVNGPNVRQGQSIQANIADITPTILAAAGLRVPADMEGQALAELFDKPLCVEFEPPQVVEVAEHEEVYTDKEKEALTRRLADLGYLE
ncbi:MAG: alkaline phosphatase family protein [Planctomycetota bacterium]|nr:MAG: alkaline phosphatase family protein [Planctomycetota bacterium]